MLRDIARFVQGAQLQSGGARMQPERQANEIRLAPVQRSTL
jgi:hypothetical protein